MNRPNRAARRAAERAARGAAQREASGAPVVVFPPPRPITPAERFGEPCGPEHEETFAAISDALARHGRPQGDTSDLVVVAYPMGSTIMVASESKTRLARELAARGHRDFAAAILRPVPPGAVRTAAIGEDSYQTGHAFWAAIPINSGSIRGVA